MEARAEAITTAVGVDPACGILVDKTIALHSERAQRSYDFCSFGCQRTFEAPEQELKSMRARVAVAPTGVMALAVLRVGTLDMLDELLRRSGPKPAARPAARATA